VEAILVSAPIDDEIYLCIYYGIMELDITIDVYDFDANMETESWRHK
jgi:hypothetical protein